MSEDIYKAGDSCGPYRIDRFLEAGGFSEVYAATNRHTGRLAALKVLQTERARRPEVLDRFQREIRLLASLDHVNVVSFYEAGGEGPLIWAAMELLQGRSLRAHIHERGALDVEEALTILYDVACGVAAAQEVGVVHRDIKPENVFLTLEGVAKVLDFGIAKFEGWGFRSTGRGNRHVLGTPSYMSPEQIGGETPTFASDVYQAGLCAYEMLAGKHPWSYQNGDFPTQTQICDLQVTATPRPLLGVRADVRALVDRCLAKRPEDRFPDMDALAMAVWEILETVRGERRSRGESEDQRNPSASDGTPLGPLARRAYEPAHTPLHETPPPTPAAKVELRAPVVHQGPADRGPVDKGRPATLPPAPIARTVPIELPEVPRASGIQRTVRIAVAERTTAPMPAPGAAPVDHTPAWVPPPRPAVEVPHFLDYIVPQGTPELAPPQPPPRSVTPATKSVPVPSEAPPDAEPKPEAAELGEAPTWLVALMITSAVASATIAGYYLFFDGPAPVAAAAPAATAGPRPTATARAADAPAPPPSAAVTAVPPTAMPSPSAAAAPSAPAAAPASAAAPAPTSTVAPRAAQARKPPPPVSPPAPPATASARRPRAPHRLIDSED